MCLCVCVYACVCVCVREGYYVFLWAEQKGAYYKKRLFRLLHVKATVGTSASKQVYTKALVYFFQASSKSNHTLDLREATTGFCTPFLYYHIPLSFYFLCFFFFYWFSLSPLLFLHLVYFKAFHSTLFFLSCFVYFFIKVL